MNDLTPEERDILSAMRRASGAEQKLERLTFDEFRDRMRTRLGLGPKSIYDHARRLQRTIADEPGVPPVVLTGTMTDLRVSWQLHEEGLIRVGKGPSVLRHHREAVRAYCRCAEIPWIPTTSAYERRAKLARARAAEVIQLPDDFIARVHRIVHDTVYHSNKDVNATYQVRLRTNFKTGPRTPSEDARFRLDHIHPSRGVIMYFQSKIGGVENEPVLVPREVFDIPPNVLTSPVHKSLRNYIEGPRERLLGRLIKKRGEEARHDRVYLGPLGTPMDENKYRMDLYKAIKPWWPEFYPYLTREIAIIMKALDIIAERGHLDYELLMQWSGHASLNNLRRYTRKARQLLRESIRGKTDLKATLNEWKAI